MNKSKNLSKRTFLTILDEAQQAEAVQILTTIHSFRTIHLKSVLGAADVMYVIGQFYQQIGDMRKCKECAQRSLETYEKELGREHSTTLEVKLFYKSVLNKIEPSEEKSSASANTNKNRRGSFNIATHAQ